MKHLQKIGGVAALYSAAAYTAAIVYFLVIVDYASLSGLDQKVAFLTENYAGMHLLTLISYVIFGVSLATLALALYERLQTGARPIMQVATAMGLIWAGALIASGMVFNAGLDAVVQLSSQNPAQAATVWLGIEAVAEGLGNGNGEILGGLWMLLVSWAALQTGELPRALNYLGLAVGAVGVISIAPWLHDLGVVFGLAQIVWFAWLGLILLRRPSSATAPIETSAPYQNPLTSSSPLVSDRVK
jgi:hypothetical protein